MAFVVQCTHVCDEQRKRQRRLGLAINCKQCNARLRALRASTDSTQMTTQLVLVAGSRVLRRVGVRLQSQCTIRRAARRAARRTRSVMKKRRRKTYMLEHQTWIRAISLRAERRRTGSAPGLRLLSRPRIRSSRGRAVVWVCWWVWMVVRFFCH